MQGYQSLTSEKEKLQYWILKARTDFRTFFLLCAPIVASGNLIDSVFHTNVLCLMCQLKFDKKLKHTKIGISIPPGHTKTIICNVLFSAWVLGRKPNLRSLVGTNSQDEGNKRNVDVRELMQSDIYRKIFPNTSLINEEKTWLTTNAGGGRRAVTTDVAKRFTGADCDLLIIDDPNDTTATEIELQKVTEWYDKKASRRLRLGDNNLGFLLIQQRVDPKDLTGYIKENDADFFHLVLRAEEDEDVVYKIPLINDEYITINRKAGYLWERAAKEYYESVKNKINQSTWLRQYQQDVTALPDGALWNYAMIQESYMTPYNENLPKDEIKNKMQTIVIGVDPAVSTEKDSDLTGIVVCGHDGYYYYVLEDASGKFTPDQWASKVEHLWNKWNANVVIAEKNQGGDLIKNILNKQRTPIYVKDVHARKGKITRAEPIVALYEKKLVKHIKHTAEQQAGNYLQELEQEMLYYAPNVNASSPDRMDAMVYAMYELSQYTNELNLDILKKNITWM